MRFEQYEIWVLNGERWEFASAFMDFDVAVAASRARITGVRLVHAVYEEGRCTQQDVLAEVGATRKSP